MRQSTHAGFQRRIKVNLIWIGTTLRLEALGHRFEVRPDADGIKGVFIYGHQEFEEVMIDLSGDPKGLVADWMKILDTQKKVDAEAAQKAMEEARAAEEAEG